MFLSQDFQGYLRNLDAAVGICGFSNFFIAQYPIIESQGFYSNQIKGESGLRVKITTVLYKYLVLKRTILIIYKQQLCFFFLFKRFGIYNNAFFAVVSKLFLTFGCFVPL